MSHVDPMKAYSEALDEIWRLRGLLAVEAGILEAHLALKGFPKSRRAHAEAQVDRMLRAAQGQSSRVYYEHPGLRVRAARHAAHIPETLTRAAWEQSLVRPQVEP